MNRGPNLRPPAQRPRVLSVAGTDSGGGAGLSADQRAVEALGAHLCPVVAAITAQNSLAVQHVQAITPVLLLHQLHALADDLPPHAVKTGLLGSAANARVLADWLDAQQTTRHGQALPLVVDPVLRASTGAALADPELIQAYRTWLLPRATLITPNRREAAALIGLPHDPSVDEIPALAAGLRAMGAQAVLITGGDAATEGQASDWLDSPQASGWLSSPRLPTRHHHGTGCTLASAAAASLARGFVPAEAVVLAKMLCTQALRHGHPQGAGDGPVDARLLAWLPAGVQGVCMDLPRLQSQHPLASVDEPLAHPLFQPGLYGIVDSAAQAAHVLQQSPWPLRHLQLRRKRPAGTTHANGLATLREEMRHCARLCAEHGVRFWLNDHAELALEACMHGLALGVHLGQEDWLSLGEPLRAQITHARRHHGLGLGMSSHSLWELSRAASISPDYIACGPVWPTTTKQMPWRPQGLDNLAWWCAVSPAPVVAIGGLLRPHQAREVALAGAQAACLVRSLNNSSEPPLSNPRVPPPGAASPAAWLAAFEEGRTACTNLQTSAPLWPHPALP